MRADSELRISAEASEAWLSPDSCLKAAAASSAVRPRRAPYSDELGSMPPRAPATARWFGVCATEPKPVWLRVKDTVTLFGS